MEPASSAQFDHELSATVAEEAAAVNGRILALLHRWYATASSGGNDFGYHVLNEAAFLLPDNHWRSTAWRFYQDLATRADEQNDQPLKMELTIALFEIIAEPPWYGWNVELLFGLLDHPSTRWAVFAAYRYYPRTFLRHLRLYGKGRITLAEYEAWLARQGLVQTPRGLRFKACVAGRRSRGMDGLL